MTSGSKAVADASPSDVEVPTEDDTHTDQGAPTDAAHQEAGDGALSGSTPAGLTADELTKSANSGKSCDGGTG